MTAQSGLIARRDKSPTSTNSEGVPCSSQQLNSQCGQNAACPWSRYMRRNTLILCHANRQCSPFLTLKQKTLRPGGSLQTGTNTLRLVLQSGNITDYWIDWLRVEP